MIEISMAVLAVAAVVLVAAVIPTLLQIRRAAQSADRLLSNLEREVTPLLTELRTLADHANAVATDTREGARKLNTLLTAVGEVGDTIRAVDQAIHGHLGRFLISATSLAVGLRAGFRHLFRSLRQGRSDKGDAR